MLSSPRGEILDTESRFTKWELIASQRSAIYQTKSNLVALPPLTKLSVKFKRNRLPNVQDITFFSIRPPPNFCLINLFMSSLSPAALNRKSPKTASRSSEKRKKHSKHITGKIFQTLFRFLGILHGKLPIYILDRISAPYFQLSHYALVNCGRSVGFVFSQPRNWNCHH